MQAVSNLATHVLIIRNPLFPSAVGLLVLKEGKEKKRGDGGRVPIVRVRDLFSNCEIRRYSVFSCFPGRANYKHCDRAKMLLLLLKQKRK